MYHNSLNKDLKKVFDYRINRDGTRDNNDFERPIF